MLELLRDWLHAGGWPGAHSPANSSRVASFPKKASPTRGNFRHFLWAPEPDKAGRVSYRGTALTVKMPASIRFPPKLQSASLIPESSMTITATHIPAIVALIAGILILIMPRFLNFVVAIYLIFVGLVGLGLLRWLHM
jgi:hypothetical protein